MLADMTSERSSLLSFAPPEGFGEFFVDDFQYVGFQLVNRVIVSQRSKNYTDGIGSVFSREGYYLPDIMALLHEKCSSFQMTLLTIETV